MARVSSSPAGSTTTAPSPPASARGGVPDQAKPMPGSPAAGVADRLPRLLSLVPYLLARPGVPIAEAAADGAMHQPGPGFGAVEVRLAQPGKPPALPELTALLPGVPAAAGLDLIRERVAARMWQAVQKHKDSPATK